MTALQRIPEPMLLKPSSPPKTQPAGPQCVGLFVAAVLVSNEWNLRLEEFVKFYGETEGRQGGGDTLFRAHTLSVIVS